MKFDTPAHELAHSLADDWDGDVQAPTGAFASVDLDETISDQHVASLVFRQPHLFITEDSDGHVYIKGYEREERDRVAEKSAGAFALWSADISDEDAQQAIAGYLEAALFTAVDEDGESLDGLGHTWSSSAQHAAFVTVVEFITAEADDCREFAEKHAGWHQVGIDYLFTRNGEGAGFWDRGVGPVGERLTAATKPYGGVHVFLNDDNELEFESA